MTDERKHEGGRRERSGVAAVVTLLLFVLPCLYVFALGPLIWLEERGYLPEIVRDAVEGAYMPLFYIGESNATLRELYDKWYSCGNSITHTR